MMCLTLLHRYRELFVLLVAPAMALTAICLALVSTLQGTPLLLVPDRAHSAYWRTRGELQTSILRSFTHHMRLRPYAAATLIDAGVSLWAFSHVFGLWQALQRFCVAAAVSVGLCWGLDWYMRCRFVRVLARGR